MLETFRNDSWPPKTASVAISTVPRCHGADEYRRNRTSFGCFRACAGRDIFITFIRSDPENQTILRFFGSCFGMMLKDNKPILEFRSSAQVEQNKQPFKAHRMHSMATEHS